MTAVPTTTSYPNEARTGTILSVQHGNRHPHAWSIVDEKELVKWLQSLSN